MRTTEIGEYTKIPNGKVVSGDKLGHLTVLHTVPNRSRKWVCLCECGNKLEAYQTDLLRKKIVSCGCIKHTVLPIKEASTTPSHRRKDLTGQTFNSLTAIKLEGVTSSGNSVWSFKCVCGNIITRAARQVTRGDITSCGCRKKELLRKAFELPNDQAIKNQAYKEHWVAANKRGYESKLTQEQHTDLISKPCYYCGEISLRTNRGTGEKKPYNSVDRLNNEPFYDSTNAVPCCFICQKMKTDYKEAEFLTQIKAIYLYRKL